MGIKQLIEEHPLPILIGVAVATATATGGATSFILTSKFDAEKAKIETEYKSEVSKFNASLARIERKIGNEEQPYFDVSQLIITPDKIRGLDQAYKSVNDGDFYYLLPRGNDWNYSVISEGALVALKMTPQEGSLIQRLAGALNEKTVHLWRNSQSYTVSAKAKSEFKEEAPKSFTFFPMVTVQKINEKQLMTAMGAISSVMDEESNAANIMKKIDELLKGIEQTLPSSSDSSGIKTSDPKPQQSTAPVTPEENAESKSRRMEMEKTLSTLFRGDMVAVVLAGIIRGAYDLPKMIEGAEASLDSIQKKGNVLYMKVTLKFDSALIAGQDTPKKLTVDREVFVATNTKDLYIVQVEVPTIDRMSSAYPWVSQWLSSIRIPI